MHAQLDFDDAHTSFYMPPSHHAAVTHFALAAALSSAVQASRTFGVSLKGVHLPCGTEQEVYSRECMYDEAPCTMQHWWSGGTFEGYTATKVVYHVDGGQAPSVTLPLGPAHGSSPSFMDDNGPWSAGGLFGKSGVGLHEGGPSHGSGLFNTIHVPFQSSINVTVALGCSYAAEYFWLVLRGRTKAKVVLPGGLELPPTAHLRSFQTSATNLEPSAFLPVLDTSTLATQRLAINAVTTERTAGGGAVLFTTISVEAPKRSFQFLEGCLRASAAGNATDEWLLSSGTEDYFLGTFYFDKGRECH